MTFDDLVQDVHAYRAIHFAYPSRWLLLGCDFDRVWGHIREKVDRFALDAAKVERFQLLGCTVIRIEEINIPGPIRSRP